MSRTLLAPLALLLPLLLAAPAAAQPRVTLKLENVTLLQALTALQRETGWEFKMDDHSILELEDEAKDPRASFSWEAQSVGAVCRELGAKFDFQPRLSRLRGVEFKSGLPRPAPPLYEVTNAGFSVSLSRLERTTEADQEFGKAAAPPLNRYQNLTLTVRPLNGDPDLVDGILNLQIITDRGPVEGFAREGWQRGSLLDGGPPDAWELKLGQLQFPPRATEIVRLSGELRVHRQPRFQLVRLPLPAPQVPAQLTMGTVKVDLTRLEVSPSGRVALDAEVTWPVSDVSVGARLEWPPPLVATRSARIYPLTGDRSMRGENGIRHLHFHSAVTLPRLEDPPTALLWDVPLPEEPATPIYFRLRNIPIPPIPPDTPVKK